MISPSPIYLVPIRSDRANSSTEGAQAGQAGGRIDEEIQARKLNSVFHVGDNAR